MPIIKTLAALSIGLTLSITVQAAVPEHDACIVTTYPEQTAEPSAREDCIDASQG